MLLDSRKKWTTMWILGLFLPRGLFRLHSTSVTWRAIRSQWLSQTTAMLAQQPNAAAKWHPSPGRSIIRSDQRWSKESTHFNTLKWIEWVEFQCKISGTFYFSAVSRSLVFSPGFRSNEYSSLYQPGGGRLQQDSDSSGALPSQHWLDIQFRSAKVTVSNISLGTNCEIQQNMLLKIPKCGGIVFIWKKTPHSFLIRSIVCGLWRGVCAVGVCSEAGADQSSVSVRLGAAGGGLPWAAGLLTSLPRPATALPQHPSPDVPK